MGTHTISLRTLQREKEKEMRAFITAAGPRTPDLCVLPDPCASATTTAERELRTGLASSYRPAPPDRNHTPGCLSSQAQACAPAPREAGRACVLASTSRWGHDGGVQKAGKKKERVKGPLQGSGHISSLLSEGALEFRTRGCMGVSPKTLFPKLGENYGEP